MGEIRVIINRGTACLQSGSYIYLCYCFQTLKSVVENSKEELDYLNRTGQMLVHDVDHQLVNSAPILDQLATLNTNYKDVLYRLEVEQIKLEQVY